MRKPYSYPEFKSSMIYRPYIYGDGGAVSSNSLYATQAGLEILNQGGNAFDAAVAISLALGVVEPFHSGIGGGFYTVFYQAETQEVKSFDARGGAPKEADINMFLKDGEVDQDIVEFSGRSATVPAHYRGVGEYINQNTTKSLEELSQPAIRLAEEGYHVGFRYEISSDSPADYPKLLKKAERFDGFRELYMNGDQPRKLGQFVKNPKLAQTMRDVAANGVDWFYQGPIADAVVDAVNQHQGTFTKEDLSEYQVVYREPIHGTYRDHDVYSMAPPYTGGVHIVQMLNILEQFDMKSLGFHSAQSTHILAETMKMMFADRSVAMGDPDFVQINFEKLLSKDYAKYLADQIDPHHAQTYQPDEDLIANEYVGETSSFSVADQYGNVVVQTQSLGNRWGSGLVLPEYGFVMNNNMVEFNAKAGIDDSLGLANAIRPGKNPMSSMSPTIVMKDNKPYIAVGAAGSQRILTSILEMIINVLDYDLGMDQAIKAPYIFPLPQDAGLTLEFGYSPDTLKLLEELGHTVVPVDAFAKLSVSPTALLIDDGVFYPGNSERTDGGAGAINQDGTWLMDGIHFRSDDDA